jgi:hypothetical protein
VDFLTEQSLNSWRVLAVSLPHLTEEQVNNAIEHEIKNGKRKSMLKRLHQRIGVLRQAREWENILERISHA